MLFTWVYWYKSNVDHTSYKCLQALFTSICFFFQIYFTYLQNWLLMLQNLPEASRSLKNVLEMEWDFTKQICPHVTGGEAEAGKRFRYINDI